MARNLTVRLTDGTVVDCKLHKVKPRGINRPVIVERDEEGEIIFKKRKTDTGVVFDKFKWIKVDANGSEYKPKKINKYQVLEDGSEELIKFPEATKSVSFSFRSVLPATYVGRLLPVSQYELVATEPEAVEALYYEMERLLEKDVAFYASPFVWKKGSLEQYHAIFQPYNMGDGKFGWSMFTSQGRIEYEHTMDLAGASEDAGEAIRTLEPLAGLITVQNVPLYIG